MRVGASNVDPRGCCAYCYLWSAPRHARNTHVIKWQRGGQRTGVFAGMGIEPGTRRYACRQCAAKIAACEAGYGNTVGVYRYRTLPEGTP